MSEILSHLHASAASSPPHIVMRVPQGWQRVSDILMVLENTFVRTENCGVLKSHLTPFLER